MIALGMDTSGQVASVAIAKHGSILHHCETNQTLSHSEMLWPMTEECLRASDCNVAQIDVIGMVIGPGSFTGLRIGISFVMGFCAPRQIPCVPVSSLDVIARSSGFKNRKVRPLLDARRNEVFTALFECRSDSCERLEPDHIEKTENICVNGCTLVTVGASRFLEDIIWPVVTVSHTSSASTTALLAMADPKACVSAKVLRPAYFRPSAAEERQNRSAR